MNKVILVFLILAFSSWGEGLFPHKILVDGNLIKEIDELTEPIKIETASLKIKIDPVGSMTILQKNDWIYIQIEPQGTITFLSSQVFSISPKKIGKNREITSIDSIFLRNDLSSGKIRLSLKDTSGVGRDGVLTMGLSFVWKKIIRNKFWPKKQNIEIKKQE